MGCGVWGVVWMDAALHECGVRFGTLRVGSEYIHVGAEMCLTHGCGKWGKRMAAGQ